LAAARGLDVLVAVAGDPDRHHLPERPAQEALVRMVCLEIDERASGSRCRRRPAVDDGRHGALQGEESLARRAVLPFPAGIGDS